MRLGENIKRIRKQQGILQKAAAEHVGMTQSNFSRMEAGNTQPNVDTLIKLSGLFGVTVDYIINPDTELPHQVTIQDKGMQEQVRLLSMLPEEDRALVSQIIDKLLTNLKFKQFFEENLAE